VIERLLFAAIACVGCGGAPRYGRASGTVSELSLRTIEWNPSHADVGKVQAVADSGDDVVVFSDLGATVMVSGAVVAVDRSITRWASASTMPAPDGSGTWIVGIDADGTVRRVRARSTLEPVSERFGLTKARVREVAPLGAGFIAFALDTQIAIADSTSVLRYELTGFRTFVGGGGRGVALFDDAMRVMDPAHQHDAIYRLEGARHVAIDESGRLFAATTHALYAEDDRGRLALRYLADGVEITGLVASGKRVWFAEGSELGVIEGDRIEASKAASIPKNARLHPSNSGDVWTVASGTLARHSREVAASDPWTRDIAPVFARACSKCHQKNGPAGVDLSTRAAWEKKRSDIKVRVLEERSMPPKGAVLEEADRKIIETWIGK